MSERVVIFYRQSKEWYRAFNKGLTRDRSEAHAYCRREAERLINDCPEAFELQPANENSSFVHSQEKP